MRALQGILTPFASTTILVAYRRFHEWLTSLHYEIFKMAYFFPGSTLSDSAAAYWRFVDYFRWRNGSFVVGGTNSWPRMSSSERVYWERVRLAMGDSHASMLLTPLGAVSTWTAATLARYTAAFGSSAVRVLNMHSETDVLIQIACSHLHAQSACAQAMSQGRSAWEAERNEKASLLLHDVLSDLVWRGLVEPGVASNASGKAALLALERAVAKQPALLDRLPLQCLSDEEVLWVHELGAHAEAALLPEWHNASVLQHAFEQAEASGAFCSVDTRTNAYAEQILPAVHTALAATESLTAPPPLRGAARRRRRSRR